MLSSDGSPKKGRALLRIAIALLVGACILALVGCDLLTSLVDGRPPTVAVTASPESGPTPLVVHFDGSLSSDDGVIVEYVWDFGDGHAETVEGSPTIEHLYDRPGQFAATLTVTDDRGQVSAKSVTILVENRVPIPSCRLSSDAPVVGELIQFDASGSFDPDGQVVDFRWEFGDGETARGTRVSHTYTEEAVCTMCLTIEDDAGGVASLEHTMTVHLGGSGGCGGGSGVCL